MKSAGPLFCLLLSPVTSVLSMRTGEKFVFQKGGKAFDRFITIWLENQDYAKVILDPKFADLKRDGISLTKYYAHTHPSQPNYLAAISGDYFGLDHDNPVKIPENVSTIVDVLDTKRITWGGYFEDLPGPGYMGIAAEGKTPGKWDYVRKHNPFASFGSIYQNGSRLWHVGGFDDFADDLGALELPQFVFMSPNMLNDGHNTSLDYATSWAHTYLKPLLADDAFKDGRTLIHLTYDESEDYAKPNKIASLLLGSAVPKALRGTEDDTFYTHYSVLSSVEHNWNLPNLGRYDVGANVWKFLAAASGYENKGDPPTLAGINCSESYPGFLNSVASKWKPIPQPNLKLVGAGGQGVVDSVTAGWGTSGAQNAKSPYDGSGEPFDGGQYLPEYFPQEANVKM